MAGFNFSVDKLSQELLDFNTKLANSYSTLQKLDDIDVGQTPHKVVYQEDKLRLLHFQPQGESNNTPPLLICYALVNRYYMIDLEPKRSILRRLLEQGQEIYVIDWGYPDAADRYLDLDDYINEYLNNCVDFIRKRHDIPAINLLGICQGGTFSLCYTALNPKKIKNLITMVTPVDFHTPTNLLTHLSQKIDADLAVDTYGNIPGSVLNHTYNSLMPMRLGVQKCLGIPSQMTSEENALSFLRMEKWIYDSPDQAGEAFRSFVKQFFQQNLLVKGKARIGQRLVDLKNIKQPILNIYGSFDHLVPPDASRALADQTSSQQYEEMEVRGGHIGVFVSSKAQSLVAPKVVNWLTEH